MRVVNEEKIRESIIHIDNEEELGIKPHDNWTQRQHAFNLIYRMVMLFAGFRDDIPSILIVKQIDLVIKRAEKYRNFLIERDNLENL